MENSRPKFPIHITEERTIKRITFSGVISDAISAFNIERGLVYTLKLLLFQPGELLQLYLNEGRYRVFNAFRLLLLTTAVSLFLMYLVGPEDIFGDFSTGWNNKDNKSNIDPEELQRVFLDWYNILLWIAIPIYALFSFVVNRRVGYNYAEHLVMQSFYISAINVISSVLIVLTVYTSFSWVVVYAIMLISFVYYLWILIAWFRKGSLWFVVKNVVAFLLANLIYIIISSMTAMTILLKGNG